jgi:DNA-binding response OmpR family regulator
VRVLLLAQGPGATALVQSLDPEAFLVTVASRPTQVPSTEMAAFDAILIGPEGPLDRREQDCRALRNLGHRGAILALCDQAAEGESLLNAGADDFMASPYDPSELGTRLRVCARRTASRSHLRWGKMDLDRLARVVRIGDASIALSARECELLACLIEEGGHVVSRARLRERVWQRKEDRGTNLVEVYLSRVRDKLGEHAVVIETVRRAGYRLRR